MKICRKYPWAPKAKHPHTWQFEDARGSWKIMDDEYQEIYETLYMSGQTQDHVTHAYGDGGRKTYRYHIDLGAMTQTNETTGKVRRVRRATWSQLYN